MCLKIQEILANAHQTRESHSSSCSKTVSLSPAISSQFIIGVCAAKKIANISKNPLFWKFRVFQSHRC